jgi:riboflavin synthase
VFTGIVEEMGRLEAREGNAFTFTADLVTQDAQVGGSIAVNGCCLTVVAHDEGWWRADVVDETLSRTNLAGLQPGDRVNLERPVRVGDRLAGHLVQGHVDGIGDIVTGAPDVTIRPPADLLPYIVPKGSITVDGCSLTITHVGADRFGISVVPHTAAVTTLGFKHPGDHVNLEVDVVAKYVESLLARAAPE